MSVEPQIKQLFQKLNPKWFSVLKDEFINHPFYNKNLKIISDVVQEQASGYDPETGEGVDDVYDVVIEATLPEYAWCGADHGFYCPEQCENYFILKATSLTPNLFEIVEPLLTEINDLKDKNTLLELVVKFIIEAGYDLKKQLNEAFYHEVIDHCVHCFRVALSTKYSSIKKAHDTIVSYEDKLYFDLSQKELAFLLATLIRSGFIYGASDRNSTFQNFFSKYFYFKNQREGNLFNRATGINKKISDVYSPNNTDYQSIKEEMKDRLIQAIKEL